MTAEELPLLSGENKKRILAITRRLALLPLAKAIYTGRFKQSENPSLLDLIPFIEALGSSPEDAFEFHMDRTDSELELVRHCIENDGHRAGIVLLFTLLEGEVNSAIRILLRIRGYSNGAISDALKGINFTIKFDVLLPVLGATPSERTRQLALQCNTIRNMVVHEKATPHLWTDDNTQTGSYEAVREKAKEFFISNPYSRIVEDVGRLVEEAALSSPEMQQALKLLEWLDPSESNNVSSI